MLATVRKTVLCAGVVTLAAVLSAPSPAEAAMKLQLCSVVAADCVEIEDGSGGDSNATVGAITWIGSIGNFTVNVSTGISKPVLDASPSIASMDLNSVNVSTAADELFIYLTDTDFPAALEGALHGDVGGTTQTGGTAEFAACKDPENTEYSFFCDTETGIFLGPFGPVAFAGSASDAHGAFGSPYSMTLIAHITHSGAGTTSFDFLVENIAEPTTLALFGLGLIGVGTKVVRRRQRR